MMQEEEWEDTIVPRWDVNMKEEETRSQSEKTQDAKKWDYLVSERELKQIKKHIHRAEQARGLRDHEYRLVPQRIPRPVLFTDPSTLEKDEKAENIQKTPKATTKTHTAEWTKEQIKRHQDRMIRGRELTKQRNDQHGAQKLGTQAPPLLKAQVQKEEVQEFEQVTAYPIVQPHPEALIQVTILREKSKEEGKIKKPLRRELLCIPPFLKSQLEKNKVKNYFPDYIFYTSILS
ncbi:putative uncharacterized protein ZNRD1-AS1 [Rousettus aegyptiacus]|uniref:Uncharacterized protein n=1 Tax=Rousettus aegyptiacus TaxID=9407 RepID=A0A7J8GIW0_ROUAE|nr:putative uncharacterized protein ZNRD1-AS1 [Rousettus aegyptiacus]XP_036079536.1 putative uncharacterized protein ZNRD1-AS1 [Rousettus aegyptiacus]XP_036079537.1 putative uncharacterized protein ZNRD1-AS1 [Rousettus aegyptiacus]XP_036079539.1 putative uncharacterized protein ZNRD1-AS1 [Rousettus aegyptiacus]KAF6459890.1 hypothetical protein HJG63_021322 [Rousettus aegyptiacus]